MAVITLTLGVGIGVTGALLIARPATATACPESPEVCADFAVFWEAWELASERYVESEAVVPPEMIAGAVNGMLDTLGDEGHTRFLSAEEAEAWDESLRGAFEGIGAYIDERDGQLIIVAPIEGSPAEAAGIRPGDQILAVNGESTAGWSIDELVSRVRGPEGSEVRLQVIHPGETEPVDLTIQRAEVIVPSVSWRLLEDQTALVSVRSFDDDTGDELERALSEAIASGAQAVVLDLRNNPGGLLDEAIQAASQFLPAGTPVLLEENRDGERQVTEARRGGVALDIPLVVLINENSASAAEILSGALQDAGRATLIGVPTFGTGTVLTPYRLSDGSRLLLGTEQWLTPSGRLIRNQGINPDELVDLPLDVAPLSPAEAAELSTQALLENPDVQLVRALELVDQVIGQR
ncbi:MAG: S41 family peptidase [Oscillochloris sp.]|nr:S41 family peptidase [Oscillochloris sp.]